MESFVKSVWQACREQEFRMKRSPALRHYQKGSMLSGGGLCADTFLVALKGGATL